MAACTCGQVGKIQLAQMKYDVLGWVGTIFSLFLVRQLCILCVYVHLHVCFLFNHLLKNMFSFFFLFFQFVPIVNKAGINVCIDFFSSLKIVVKDIYQFILLAILNFSGIRYIHVVVQPSVSFISRPLFILETKILCP